MWLMRDLEFQLHEMPYHFTGVPFTRQRAVYKKEIYVYVFDTKLKWVTSYCRL